MGVIDEKKTGELGSSADPSAPPPPPPHYHGEFQGVKTNLSDYPPPPPYPAMGFPQPMPPPGASDQPQYYDRGGYQAVPGYAVAEGGPVDERRLPCCGIGCGWFLFIIGFFLGAIPWYVAVIIFLCKRRTMDYREKPGFCACIIAAVIATIAYIVGATKGAGVW